MPQNAYDGLKPFFWLGTILILAAGLYFLFWSKKELAKFKQVTGIISFLAKTHPDAVGMPDAKNRYVQLSNFDKPFELYLGGDTGDFLPEFQAYDQLKMGDTITVYYNETPPFVNASAKIIVFTQQINKNGQPYYLRGDMNLYFANFFIMVGVLLALFLHFYKS
ncbi:hypothetical protein [Adhaeribacter pallidiroseus]|uniref:DUF3592 domain-containing protein n=1 Tax=Adhaeribacter pallidiroseus TaxID=2072847 RepID=A0A369QCD6_9BACT|nr:hypothetical protein [Adhaeribacter pallidiroseus]RDC62364.1 hypothetical protein AHMF7616_00957 [Adhaeribacter pallidiroseus]